MRGGGCIDECLEVCGRQGHEDGHEVPALTDARAETAGQTAPSGLGWITADCCFM